MDITTLTPFQRGYLETALWADTDEDDMEKIGLSPGGKYDEGDIDISVIAPESIANAVEDCDMFLDAVEKGGSTELRDRVDCWDGGHDFWLTHQGHGAGFWDGDWGGAGDTLTEISGQFGQVCLYVDDDGQVYID